MVCSIFTCTEIDSVSLAKEQQGCQPESWRTVRNVSRAFRHDKNHHTSCIIYNILRIHTWYAWCATKKMQHKIYFIPVNKGIDIVLHRCIFYAVTRESIVRQYIIICSRIGECKNKAIFNFFIYIYPCRR